MIGKQSCVRAAISFRVDHGRITAVPREDRMEIGSVKWSSPLYVPGHNISTSPGAARPRASGIEAETGTPAHLIGFEPGLLPTNHVRPFVACG